MPNLYIIAGCNGAGKTTASMTVLPEILNCYEFVNADEIARGLSPFQPEKVAIEAGRNHAGLRNFIHLYMPVCDEWLVFDNSLNHPIVFAEGQNDSFKTIYNDSIWEKFINHGK